MKLLLLLFSIFIASIAILFSYFSPSSAIASSLRGILNWSGTHSSPPSEPLMGKLSTLRNTIAMSSLSKPASTAASSTPHLAHAKIQSRRSSARGHANHGWLNSYHSFSFADYYDRRFQSFGSIRVLNEDRVAGGTGFPTHPHRDAEIFSYILSGELTHRDSMLVKGKEGEKKEGRHDFYRMRRGDVQFTTGGTGIAHSEQNESDTEVHFLQIWALPWSRGLTPRYHTHTFPDASKRDGFVTILSPLKAGKGATKAEEEKAEPSIEGTIPIHADLLMGAGILGKEATFRWRVGGGDATGGKAGEDGPLATRTKDRRVYVHVPMCKDGKAQIKIDGREDIVLKEGDGAFVSDVKAGDVFAFQNVGEVDAEVVVLDSD